MSDIVERLRRDSRWEEADHIEHLRRDRDDYKQLYADALRDYVKKRNEVERLRAALTRLIAWEGAVELACPELGGLLKAMYDARAALEANDE